jgi:hypothetical protein
VLIAASHAASAQDRFPQNACTNDAIKLCPNVKPGEGRVIACLVKDKSKLTAACVKLLTSMGAMK